MIRLTQIIVITTAIFAVTLATQAAKAARLRIEVRQTDGGGAGPMPKGGYTIEVRNFETGNRNRVQTDNKGVARIKNLPKGKYSIHVSYSGPDSSRWRRTYRDIGASDNLTITVPYGKFISSLPARIASRRALQALKKGDRAKAASGLRNLRERVKHHGQAQAELSRLSGKVRAGLMAKLPRNLRNRLEGALAIVKPDKRVDVVVKFSIQLKNQVDAVEELMRKIRPGKNRRSIMKSHRSSSICLSRILHRD